MVTNEGRKGKGQEDPTRTLNAGEALVAEQHQWLRKCDSRNGRLKKYMWQRRGNATNEGRGGKE